MTENNKEALSNLIKNFINVSQKHNEILERQAQALLDNMVNKDCKSKIYERIATVEEKCTKINTHVEHNEKRIQKLEECLIGDNYYSKGLIAEIKDLKEIEIKEIKSNILEIKDFVKEKNTTKKNFTALYNFLSGVGGALLLAMAQHLLK